jgi:hypothetical protein
MFFAEVNLGYFDEICQVRRPADAAAFSNLTGWGLRCCFELPLVLFPGLGYLLRSVLIEVDLWLRILGSLY